MLTDAESYLKIRRKKFKFFTKKIFSAQFQISNFLFKSKIHLQFLEFYNRVNPSGFHLLKYIYRKWLKKYRVKKYVHSQQRGRKKL